MVKKVLALMMCASLMFIIFCSCQKTETTSSQPESTPASEMASSQVPFDQVAEFTWYRFNNSEAPDENSVYEAINEYIGEKLNLYVNVVHNSADYDTLLLNALTAKQDVDLLWADFARTNKFLNANALMDLSGELDQYPDLKGSVPDNVWQAVTRPGGKMYNIPVLKEAAIGTSMMVQTSLAEKFDWDFSNVKNIYDMAPYFQELAEANQVKYVLGAGNYQVNASNHFLLQDEMSAIYNYLGILADHPEEVVILPETEVYQDYIAQMQEWASAGYISEDQLIGDFVLNFAEIKNYWATEDYLGFSMWSTVPDQQANANDRFATEVTLIDVNHCQMTNASALGSGYALSSYTEKADAVLKFVQALYTDEALANFVTYGIEGKHYNLDIQCTRKTDEVIHV